MDKVPRPRHFDEAGPGHYQYFGLRGRGQEICNVRSPMILSAVVFNTLHSLLENSLLYSHKERELNDCAEVTKCNIHKGTRPVFQEVISSVTDVLGVLKLSHASGRTG